MQTQFRLAFILAALGAATAPAAAWNSVARPASEAPVATAPLKPILVQDAGAQPEPQPGAEQPDGEGAQSDEGGMESGADADEEYWAFPKDFKFDRIPVTFPASAEAPGLTDFLATLRGISEKRDDAALVATIAPKIFWDRDFGGGFDEAL
ncbi:hypothetical protein BL864_005430, partial [Escherichia coli]|nr:hypothetical protein [Escherichia coli]